MGATTPCPYCGGSRGTAAHRPASPVALALEELNRQVAMIRKMAEEATRKDDEITLLRETVARLRGASLPSAPRSRATMAHSS